MTQYHDIQGNLHDRPAGAPVQWRIGGYAVIAREGKLLMVETVLPSAWKWDLPGGGIHLDPEETILDGIKREVFEETGHRLLPDADTLTLVDDAFFRPPSGQFWRMLTFVVHGTVGTAPEADWVLPSDEIAQVAWIDPTTLGTGDILAPQREMLVRSGYIMERSS